MGLIAKTKAALTAFRNPSLLPAVVNRNLLTAQISTLRLYPSYKAYDNSDRYCTSDDVYSVISLIAQTCAQIPLYVYGVKNEAEAKKYLDLKHNAPERVKALFQRKAMQELPETDSLIQLLESPNAEQSTYEFLLWYYTWFLSKGESIIHIEIPELGANAGRPVSLRIWEPDNVSIVVTTSYPFQITGYIYNVAGQDVYFAKPEEIIHVKNPNIRPYNYAGDNLRGFSALDALNKRFSRMEANLDASIAQMQNGGLPGIVFDKNTIDAKEIIDQRKEQYSQFIRNRDNVGNVYMASGELGYIRIGSELADMSLVELDGVDLKKLCNAFHISARLLNHDGTGSEISDDNARKGLYLNGSLPNVYLLRDALNRKVAPLFKDKKRKVVADTSGIPELQENMKELAAWVTPAWMLTGNEKREALYFDRDESNPLMDQYVIPSGMMLLSDLNLDEPEQIGDEGE